MALARRLEQLAVPVTARFFAADHEPVLGHECQLTLDSTDVREPLARTLAFRPSRLR